MKGRFHPHESEKCSIATTSGDLLRDLMDPNVPKSEREWFARSYIQEMVKKAAGCREPARPFYKEEEMSEIGWRDSELDACYKKIAALKEEVERLNGDLQKRANWLGLVSQNNAKLESRAEALEKVVGEAIEYVNKTSTMYLKMDKLKLILSGAKEVKGD